MFGRLPVLELLLVGGRTVVEHGRLSTVEVDTITAELVTASRRLQHRAKVGSR